MRLTLRTLLAYLDDALEPAQAKEIGEKIADSPVATELAARIRETLRRRRITAPQISGQGSGPDPNLTAEYLDLTLSAEGVSEFEQFCMDSDMHLAEVAACHQILTLVLGEPADVSPELRERMYALDAVTAPDAMSGTNGESLEGPSATVAADQTAHESTASRPASFEEGLPQPLRSKSLTARIIPAAIVLICAGWLALLYFDPYLRDRQTAPEGSGEGAVAAVEGNEHGAAPVDQPAAQPEPQDEEAVIDEAADAEPTTDAVDEAESAAPAESTETEPGTSNEETPVDAGTAAATEPEPETAPAEPVVPQPDPEVAFQEPPRPVEPVMIMYNSPEGILLQRNAATQEWTVLPRRALLHPGDEIACPEPFTARLQIDEGHCLITLVGGTRFKLTGPNESSRFGFELVRGRVGAFRTESDPAADGSVTVSVRVQDRTWTVSLLEPGTWCGFDLSPGQPHGKTDPPQRATPAGGIYVARGAVEVAEGGGGPTKLLPETGWLSWVSDNAGAPLLAVPNWLTPDGAALPATYRRYLTLYQKEFPLDQAVWESIPAIVRDRRPMLSKFAVETLALTGNYRELVRALSADHQESRLAAVIGLREWLAADPLHADLLSEELTMSFHDDDAAAVEKLLWGYSRDDGRDPDTSARLVEWLGSDQVAIRELALFHIEMLTGHDNDFHPMAPLAQREAAISRWREFLRRNGALVPLE
jgi:hypothetical protein